MGWGGGVRWRRSLRGRGAIRGWRGRGLGRRLWWGWGAMLGAVVGLIRRGGRDGLGRWFAEAASLVWLDGRWMVRRGVNRKASVEG